MKITKEESWSRDALYTLCNKEKWYTGGDNSEYEALLSLAEEAEPTDGNIFLAARDIAEHSSDYDANDPEDIAGIMFVIRKFTVNVFYTVEKEEGDEW